MRPDKNDISVDDRRKRNKRLAYGVLAVTFVILCLLIWGLFHAYQAYASDLLSQELESMQAIARGTAANLQRSLQGRIDDLKLLASLPDLLPRIQEAQRGKGIDGLRETILSYTLTNPDRYDTLLVADARGNILYPYAEMPVRDGVDLAAAIHEGVSGLYAVVRLTDGHEGALLLACVFDNNHLAGALIGIVDLDSVYEEVVLPIPLGQDGYITLRDLDGRILMHPVAERIGHSVYEEPPLLQEELVEYRLRLAQQQQWEWGQAVYYDQWWQRTDAVGERPVTRVAEAYSRVNYADRAFIVSVIRDYATVLAPARGGFLRAQFFWIVAIVVIACSLIYETVLLRRNEHLTLQTAHLQTLNDAMVALDDSRSQLRHYQKIQTLGSFTSGITHEFNNLLTPIVGFSELLIEEYGHDALLADNLGEIHTAALHAQEIIRQILPFCRKSDPGGVFSTVNLMEVIDESLRMVKMILPGNVQLALELPAADCWVYGDATQICQVLLNLYANAYQAIGEANGTLTVSARVQERLHTMPLGGMPLPPEVCIAVSDTGAGMTEEVRRRAFDPFFTTKAAGSGTGLGLSIVQSIVEEHGGTIDVRSAPAEGSTLTVTLPCVYPPKPQDAPEVLPAERSGKGDCVVVVDDNASIVRLTRARLSKRGYTVYAFDNAQDALDALRRRPDACDVLLTDYLMPGLTGLDLARTCRALRPDIPIIMITGLVDAQVLSFSRDGLIDAAIVKPLEYESLCTLMQKLLAQRQGGR